MGIKLMVEIFDHWQDAGLTAGERNDLLVLAENANDGTRQTFGPVHEEYILRRAGKTAESWRVAVSKLMRKKVLEYAFRDGQKVRGQTGQCAVYRLVPLCPEPPHSGYRGYCAKPASAASERGEGYPSDTPSDGLGYLRDTPSDPSDNPVDGEGYPTATDSVSSPITPTPPNPSFKIPSTTSSTSSAEPDNIDPPPAPDVTEEGGGGGSDLRSTAEDIAPRLDYLGHVPDRRQLERVTAALLAALTAGWSVEGLAVYLNLGTYRPDNPVAFYLSKLSPAKLPPAGPLPGRQAPGGHRPFECSPDSAYGHGFGTARDTADGGMWERAMARARARDAADAGYQPYRNPVDQSVYDEPLLPPLPTRPPWCGDLDCNETDRMRDGEDDTGLPFVYRCPKCHPDATRAA
jgi:hypothetical protein